MKLTFRGKFVLINISLVLITMLLLAVIVIQGLVHNNIEAATERLKQYSNEAMLYIQQEVKSTKATPDKYSSAFVNKSLSISENLSNKDYTRLLLYDLEGKILTDSANVDAVIVLDISEEVSAALELGEGQSIFVYKADKNLSKMYCAAPIYIDGIKIGVIAFIYSLELLDEIVNQVMALFFVSSLISMGILFLLSNHFTKSMLKPVRRLIESTKRVSQGFYYELADYDVEDEIGELTDNFNRMILVISDKITKVNEERQKLSAILSAIDDGIFAVSMNNEILLINENAREILGLEHQEIGSSVIDDVKFINEIIEDVLYKNVEISREVDYEDRRLHLYGTVITSDEKQLGVLIVIRDTTTLFELEKQQKVFIGNVSHELRTPLTTIIGYTDLLQRRGTDNVNLLNKSITSINQEGKRLLRLVEELLSMSSYEQLDFSMIFTKVDINALLEDVISQMQIKSQKYNVDIVYNDLELPEITGDYDRLKQVFINILDNAIKYSDSGDSINVVSSHYMEYVEISIRDFGLGIPEKDLKQIFDAFYRVDENRARESGGTGLGLSIVKSIIDKHHGEVSIESRENEGTIVVIKLLKNI